MAGLFFKINDDPTHLPTMSRLITLCAKGDLNCPEQWSAQHRGGSLRLVKSTILHDQPVDDAIRVHGPAGRAADGVAHESRSISPGLPQIDLDSLRVVVHHFAL